MLVFVPTVILSTNNVSAQTSGYTIDRVDHKVQIMYSGHIIIIDTIHVSGQVTNGFMIGLPRRYSAAVLEGFAYDQNNQYQLNLGVQLGNQTAFYGAEIKFNGNTPSIFNVAFILDNSLITEQEDGSLSLDFPAYPSLTQDVGTCNVNILFPSSPIQLTITKDDGNVNGGDYFMSNLPAFTYSIGSANSRVPTGTLQLSTVSSLTRQVNINPTGTVVVSDTYRITNNAKSLLSSFVLSLPLEAHNVNVSDGAGRSLGYIMAPAASGNMQLANVTLSTFLLGNQSTTLIAQYVLPSAVLEGGNYILANFQIFPDVSYYVNQATAIFSPPEGATIVEPQASELGLTSTVTRATYQDTLTIKETGLSHVDFLMPQQYTLQLAYNYNPVWVSLRPTFWAAFAAFISCLGAVVYRIRKPKEISYAERAEELSIQKEIYTEVPSNKVPQMKSGQQISKEDIKAFLEAYDDKKQLTNELQTMNQRAQKGKIPRRQYKVQRKAIEIRIEVINRNIQHLKAKFHSSSGAYGDLARQIDLAEEDLQEADNNIQALQTRQAKSEISLESYKRKVSDYQKQREKAEAAINGILLRFREKIR
jgi:hypothetical protein